ncbi:hypothetical protein B0H19DRAFT_535644 [Mycena capillaripes]|nr:hypothetical protein B0H19DRAFT_535644 [Mycena capillaripes]
MKEHICKVQVTHQDVSASTLPDKRRVGGPKIPSEKGQFEAGDAKPAAKNQKIYLQGPSNTPRRLGVNAPGQAAVVQKSRPRKPNLKPGNAKLAAKKPKIYICKVQVTHQDVSASTLPDERRRSKNSVEETPSRGERHIGITGSRSVDPDGPCAQRCQRIQELSMPRAPHASCACPSSSGG